MLKKEYKLKKEREFSWTFRNSKPVYTRSLVMRVSPFAPKKKSDSPNLLDSNGISRFGVVISSKREKLAVRRNALKRAIFASIKELLPRIKGGINVVIIIKENFAYPYNREEVARQVQEALFKAKVLH